MTLSRKQGISLLELIVVTSLFSIVVVVFFNFMINQSEQRRLADIKSQMASRHNLALLNVRKFVTLEIDSYLNEQADMNKCFSAKGLTCDTFNTAVDFSYVEMMKEINPAGWLPTARMIAIDKLIAGNFSLSQGSCALGAYCPIDQSAKIHYECTPNLCNKVVIQILTQAPETKLRGNDKKFTAIMKPLLSEVTYDRSEGRGLLKNITVTTCSPVVAINLGAGVLSCDTQYTNKDSFFASNLGFQLINSPLILDGPTEDTPQCPSPPCTCPSPKPLNCPAGYKLFTDSTRCTKCIEDKPCVGEPAFCPTNKFLAVDDNTSCKICRQCRTLGIPPDNSKVIIDATGCQAYECNPKFFAELKGGLLSCKKLLICPSPKENVNDRCCVNSALANKGWGAASACTKPCGGGTTTRSCAFDKKDYCNSECSLGQTKTTACNIQACPPPCAYSDKKLNIKGTVSTNAPACPGGYPFRKSYGCSGTGAECSWSGTKLTCKSASKLDADHVISLCCSSNSTAVPNLVKGGKKACGIDFTDLYWKFKYLVE